ncbi:uncharacterized protein TRIVIDRAFT_215310, partial [Trichoderma virens Gv29-8]
MVLRDISSVVINSDTSRHAAAQRIMFSPGHEPTPTSRHLVVKLLSTHMRDVLELAWPCTYTHAYWLTSRTHSHSPPLDGSCEERYWCRRFMERRARARGHRMLCSLYSNTPDTSYNNLVLLNHIINYIKLFLLFK